METLNALKGRRTVRLYQQKTISDDVLASLIDAARRSPVAMNRQTLRYTIARTPALVSQLLPLTGWAGLVKPRRTPQPGITAPAAFIAVTAPGDLADDNHTFANAGAAIHAILLAAFDQGLGTCWLGSVNKAEAAKLLAIPDNQAILYLVAVGYPAEAPLSEDITSEQSQAYYLDEQNVLHVPKLNNETITTWL